MKLTEQQKDALTELVNISFSNAANSLSELTSQRVLLDVPEVSVVQLDQLGNALKEISNEEMAAVNQLFQGEISGDAMLLLDTKSSTMLTDLLTGEEVGTRTIIDNATSEVLVEVGNIILNACLGMFGNLLQVQFSFAVPNLKVSTIEEMLLSFKTMKSKLSYALLISMRFHLKENDIEGYIIVILSVDTMSSFIKKIEELANL
jgi:chemotaxis protein CheC